MRKFKFTLIAFMAAMMALSFTACSDDPEPNPNPDPEVKSMRITITSTYLSP